MNNIHNIKDRVAKRAGQLDSSRVSGWLGRGESSNLPASDRVAAPLSSLRDPSSFGPPPKSVNRTDSIPASSTAAPPAYSRASNAPAVPHRQLTAGTSYGTVGQSGQESEAAPSGPFKIDTTGLETQNLPLPPIRMVDRTETEDAHTTGLGSTTGALAGATHRQTSPAVPPRFANRIAASGATAGTPPGLPVTAAKPKPALPPRLPPRGTPSSPPAVADGPGGTVNELQARFAKMATNRPQAGEGASSAAGKGPPPPPRTSTHSEGHTSPASGTPAARGGPPPVPLATKPV